MGKDFSAPRRVLASSEEAPQTGASIGPVFVSRRSRDAGGPGGFLHGQAGEIAEPDELGRVRVVGGEPFQGVVDGEDVFGGRLVGQLGAVEVHAVEAAAALQALPT